VKKIILTGHLLQKKRILRVLSEETLHEAEARLKITSTNIFVVSV